MLSDEKESWADPPWCMPSDKNGRGVITFHERYPLRKPEFLIKGYIWSATAKPDCVCSGNYFQVNVDGIGTLLSIKKKLALSREHPRSSSIVPA